MLADIICFCSQRNNQDMTDLNFTGTMQLFVRTVLLGSFSAAAREAGISASTVTRKISAIEKHLKVALFHRSTHEITLTEAGYLYFERVTAILSDIDDAHRAVSALDAEPSGQVKLTAPVAFGRIYLAPLIPQFLKIYPSIQLDVRLTDNHNDLVRGGFDLDIHEGENYINDLVVHPLSRNDSVLCATPEYLSLNGHPQKPADLSAHNCLQYIHPEAETQWRFRKHQSRFSHLPRGTLQSDHTELLLSAVLEGTGIAEFEIWLVRDFIRQGALKIVLPDYEFKNDLTGKFIYLAHLPNRRQSAKVRVLKSFLADRLSRVGMLTESEIQSLRDKARAS
ncbi:LysR family transcriptional regulator [Candidatus Pantoea deserta]|nr:LysR family transcriptional regulator [Pantoea deserta]